MTDTAFPDVVTLPGVIELGTPFKAHVVYKWLQSQGIDVGLSVMALSDIPDEYLRLFLEKGIGASASVVNSYMHEWRALLTAPEPVRHPLFVSGGFTDPSFEYSKKPPRLTFSLPFDEAQFNDVQSPFYHVGQLRSSSHKRGWWPCNCWKCT
jgi:hypothetical protein